MDRNGASGGTATAGSRLTKKEKTLLSSILIAVTAIVLVVLVSVAVSVKRRASRDEQLLKTEKAGLPLSAAEFTSAKQMKDADIPEGIITQKSLFEGDIDIESDIPIAHFGALQTIETAANAINFHSQPWLEWPGGVVPYKISVAFNDRERLVIAKAMGQFHKATCIKFRPHTGRDDDYIYIVKGKGCSSHVGRIKGAQRLSLGTGCVCYDPCQEGFTGIVQHEMMHAVGFHHEQSRTDRDDYVTINERNIQPGMEYNFKKYGKDKVDALGSKYDMCSLMHYGTKDFSRMGKDTITVNVKSGSCSKVGQRDGFSETDIKKINTLYKCQGYPQVDSKGIDVIVSSGCSGSADDWNCCSAKSPCTERQGDCDKNSDCEGSLVCGKNNCKDFNSRASSNADCCIKSCTSKIEVVRYVGNDDTRGPYKLYGPDASVTLYGIYLLQYGKVNKKPWWIKADNQDIKFWNTGSRWFIGEDGDPGEAPSPDANRGYAYSTKDSDCPEYPNLIFDWNYFDGDWKEGGKGFWIYPR